MQYQLPEEVRQMYYTMEVEDGAYVIRREDGSHLFTLAKKDKAEATATLAKLNAPPEPSA
jgi:hypothetical protein